MLPSTRKYHPSCFIVATEGLCSLILEYNLRLVYDPLVDQYPTAVEQCVLQIIFQDMQINRPMQLSAKFRLSPPAISRRLRGTSELDTHDRKIVQNTKRFPFLGNDSRSLG